MEKNLKKKKTYLKPRIDVITMQSERSVMIPISGTTTPEESQAKEGFWMDDEEDVWGINHPDLWKDEEL